MPEDETFAGAMATKNEVANSDENPTQFDVFFLKHLQGIQANGEWYYNQKLLGRGGNGTTFLVTCSGGVNKGIQFALKVFHKISSMQRREAFIKEADYLKRLNHPSVVKIMDDGIYAVKERNYPFMVMDYVPLTIRTMLNRKQIDLVTALRVGMHILSASAYLHNLEKPVVHCDIKPENILMSEGIAKLGDFGMAKTIFEGEMQEGREDGVEDHVQSQWPGMPYRYRTPELIERAKGDKSVELTTASDIYQIGTVLYELVTGKNPQKIVNNITDPIQLDLRTIQGDVGSRLLQLIESMLTNDPGERPSASRCLDTLDNIHQNYCGRLTRLSGSNI